MTHADPARDSSRAASGAHEAVLDAPACAPAPRQTPPPSAPPASPPRKSALRASLRESRRNWLCYLLILPGFALLGVFCLVPFLWAFSKSLYQFEIGEEAVFVGLDNYVEYLHDPTLWISLRNVLFLTGFGVVAGIAVPLLVAKLIFSLRSERARYYYRVLFLVPIVVPGVALQMIWNQMVYSDSGLINEWLRLVGLGNLATGWLANPNTVLWAIAFIGFPFAGGINILIFYAGLASIPESVHEAAWLDGATGVHKFLRIDLPLVLSQIKLLMILTLIGGIQAFEGLFVLTRGGPGFASMVPGLWMYFNAMSFQKMGYACAIGVLLFLVILSLTLLNLRFFKSAEALQEAR